MRDPYATQDDPWQDDPHQWSASRHDYFDGRAREDSAAAHENDDGRYSDRERRDFIDLRYDLAGEPEPKRCIPHHNRYI